MAPKKKVEVAGSPMHPLRACRKAGVPLVAFETVDPAATMAGCVAALNGDQDGVPIMVWDIVRGLVGINEKGKEAIGWYDPLAHQLPDILRELSTGGKAQKRAVLFVLNVQRVMDRDGVTQGLWLLRDTWKALGATCILLTPPGFTLPGELVQDVVVITEPLPDAGQVGVMADGWVTEARAAGAAIPDDYGRERVVDTLLGLSAFAAEQSFFLSISKAGLDMDGLWERKRKLVEQTPGLSVWKGKESFAGLGGLSNLKGFLTAILTSGRTPVRAIGFIDEIEKSLAGAAGDLSGVSQDQLGVFLKVMQDLEIPGIILVGPPGTGKSAIAKGAGSVSGAQVLAIDTGAMTGSLVGESQRKIRAAMETFRAVSQGKGLFIATCNKLASLPPELRRRFTLGTFYVDLPNAEERSVIWPIWRKRYGIPDVDTLPDADGWTGAEIRACCEVAWRTGYTLKDAAAFVVPVSKSASDSIEALRRQASGRFISANYPGVYRHVDDAAVPASGAGRRVTL